MLSFNASCYVTLASVPWVTIFTSDEIDDLSFAIFSSGCELIVIVSLDFFRSKRL